ncbi:MAG: polyphosphate kinase 1 [Sediminicola sp.]
MEKETLATTERFVDRDLDWLAFNERVLQEAEDRSNPIYERIKFLAIFSSNLDEFFRVRVSKLRQIGKVEKAVRKPLALKPNKTVAKLLKVVDEQQQRFGKVFRNEILPALAPYGIHLLEFNNYTDGQREFMSAFFNERIRPILAMTDGEALAKNALEDGALYLVVGFKENEELVFIPIPDKKLGRFVQIPSELGTYDYVFLEDIIKASVQQLFPDKTVASNYNIKISRDAELYLDDDHEGDWIQKIYESLRKRQEGQPTRLLFEGTMPKEIQDKVRRLLGIGKVDMVRGGHNHNFSDFFSFPNPLKDKHLVNEPMPPLAHRDFEHCGDLFELIGKGDRILHFPYQRFDYLEKWVQQAALDGNVSSIHISLYRIAKDSLLTTALLTALENNKQVVIFVEAKARFDEENNLEWGKLFEEKGATVFYSFPNVKVHSKILLIHRQEGGEQKGYAYIGTGNFNAKTSKIYCDHGLFTADPTITHDLEQVFRVLKREMLLPKLKTLLVSPFNSRRRFEDLIQFEMEQAQKGLPCGITIKMNSLEDTEMIDWLYRASGAGVAIKLLIRGFCRLRPHVKGLSENIVVTSIVDRFLEHGRVYIFHNQGNEKMFIGSADWMTRNLDKRVEVLVPILDQGIFEELKQLMDLQFSDNVKARSRDANGNNAYVRSTDGGPAVRSQYAIYGHLKSLLGAGR